MGTDQADSLCGTSDHESKKENKEQGNNIDVLQIDTSSYTGQRCQAYGRLHKSVSLAIRRCRLCPSGNYLWIIDGSNRH